MTSVPIPILPASPPEYDAEQITRNFDDITKAMQQLSDATNEVFTDTEAGIVPASGGGTTNFLRADQTWAAPPSSATNLSYTSSTRTLNSSTGTGTVLPLFTSTVAGLVPLSGGGTVNFLRADGTFAVPASSVRNDTSSVAGDAAKFWSTTFYGNPATGTADRMNRLFIGPATANSGNVPSTTSDWTATYTGTSDGIANSTLAVTSAIGSLAISGFARTSDYRTWAGGAAGGATGLYALTVNDDAVGTGIAASIFAEVFHESGAPGISEVLEVTPSSNRAVANMTPNTGIIGGAVLGANFTSAFRTGYGENISCAIALGGSVGANSAKWQQLIIVPSPEAASGVNTSVGTSGGGIFADLPRLCTIRWFGAAAAPFTGELWADINGLRFTGNIRDADGNVRVRKNRNVGANYVLVAADSDATIVVNGAFTVTFNTGVLPVGAKLRVYNNHTASITLTQGSGVTLRITGSSGGGSRSLAAYTMCEAEQIATDIWHLENAT